MSRKDGNHKEDIMIDPEEVFTDNTKLERYRLCKTCRFSHGKDNWSNMPNKDYCMAFPYPEAKPEEVRYNEDCDFYTKEK